MLMCSEKQKELGALDNSVYCSVKSTLTMSEDLGDALKKTDVSKFVPIHYQ
jgi:hypothetical protein